MPVKLIPYDLAWRNPVPGRFTVKPAHVWQTRTERNQIVTVINPTQAAIAYLPAQGGKRFWTPPALSLNNAINHALFNAVEHVLVRFGWPRRS